MLAAPPERKGWNLNSILQLIALSSIFWVGYTVTTTKEKISTIEEQVSVLRTANESKWDQLNRIEQEVNKQRDQLRDLQLDVSRLKSK
jgi:hypothetical protein